MRLQIQIQAHNYDEVLAHLADELDLEHHLQSALVIDDTLRAANFLTDCPHGHAVDQ